MVGILLLVVFGVVLYVWTLSDKVKNLEERYRLLEGYFFDLRKRLQGEAPLASKKTRAHSARASCDGSSSAGKGDKAHLRSLFVPDETFRYVL